MVSATESAKLLKEQIAATEDKLRLFREQLAVLEAQISAEKGLGEIILNENSPVTKKWPLESEEYRRYGRQMIVPDIGIQGLFYHPTYL